MTGIKYSENIPRRASVYTADALYFGSWDQNLCLSHIDYSPVLAVRCGTHHLISSPEHWFRSLSKVSFHLCLWHPYFNLFRSCQKYALLGTLLWRHAHNSPNQESCFRLRNVLSFNMYARLSPLLCLIYLPMLYIRIRLRHRLWKTASLFSSLIVWFYVSLLYNKVLIFMNELFINIWKKSLILFG